jgi:hypothetical protein
VLSLLPIFISYLSDCKVRDKEMTEDCNCDKEIEVLASFDKETMAIVQKLGYAPPGVYITEPKYGFQKEHAEKNRQIVFDYCKEKGIKI